ncbi:hypothetical protein GWG65_17945 [Bradyrhizobium sp. CSA207]|uniref:ATP-binding protein n=1 Tax=Bradyrhizobium sp. CSA207 TaxID=2698826 RepID=UPI0023AF9E26|nr:winged helix-turn-helix domain-containing protein [Bradyrhizobium sp. CSA207]MDE5443296.1 hypothetical protein [Bradyrhizobium sp. CSA207]
MMTLAGERSAERAISERVVLCFGGVRLDRLKRQIFEGETPIPLGPRAFEILLALIEARGDLVSREDLVARVWGRVHVDDGTVRAHVSKLRNALGRTQGGASLIQTESGRGYRLAAPITVEDKPSAPVREPRTQEGIPQSLSSLIGREAAINHLAALIRQNRLVTVAGAGGIGKTRLAQAVSTRLKREFPDGAVFVDLASVAEPEWVPTAVATALGKVVLSGNPTEMLVAGLKDRSVLILLDNCEHLVEAAALFCEAMARGAPRVRIIATSREILRVEGEWIYRVDPLDIPPADLASAQQALSYSAVQLFAERAAAAGSFALGDHEAPYVCALCRALDGLPLAIEMAAVQAGALGVRSLAEQLGRLQLEDLGSRRTAITRHQTLAEMLQWGHDLLSSSERALFRRLSVFAGSFTAEDAAVAADESHPAGAVIRDLAALAAKSLLSTESDGDTRRFRMLVTTRHFALDRLRQEGEEATVRQRHALLMLERLRRGAPVQIDDVRAALDWSFAHEQAYTIGLPLTLASVPLWWSWQLVEECRARVNHALESADLAGDPGTEMQLLVELFASLLQIDSHGRHMIAIAERALAIAEKLDDLPHQLRARWSLMVNAWNAGRFKVSAAHAEAFRELGLRNGDAAAILVGDRLIANIRHAMGDQIESARLLQSVLERLDRSDTPMDARLVYDQRSLALSTLAQVQFLRGEIGEAISTAQEAVREAESRTDPVSEFYALQQAACPTAIFAGHLDLAEKYLTRLETHGQRHRPYANWVPSLRGMILIRQGDVESGARELAAGIARLDDRGISANHNRFKAELATALIEMGRLEPAGRLLDELERQSETNGEGLCDPEILRLRAEIVRLSGGEQAQAEALLKQALRVALRQGAAIWELRSATSLAALWAASGLRLRAGNLLGPICAKFRESNETPEVRAARQLFSTLA